MIKMLMLIALAASSGWCVTDSEIKMQLSGAVASNDYLSAMSVLSSCENQRQTNIVAQAALWCGRRADVSLEELASTLPPSPARGDCLVRLYGYSSSNACSVADESWITYQDKGSLLNCVATHRYTKGVNRRAVNDYLRALAARNDLTAKDFKYLRLYEPAQDSIEECAAFYIEVLKNMPLNDETAADLGRIKGELLKITQ